MIHDPTALIFFGFFDDCRLVGFFDDRGGGGGGAITDEPNAANGMVVRAKRAISNFCNSNKRY